MSFNSQGNRGKKHKLKTDRRGRLGYESDSEFIVDESDERMLI